MAVAGAGPIRSLADMWLLEGRFVALVSEQVLEEVDRALGTPYFARRLSPADRTEFVGLIRREALIVTARKAVRGVASHPADDAVLAAALDGGASHLVTGDRELSALRSFRGVEIVSAREFLVLLGSPAHD
ncbi:MAG: PIN domain-containing protein [Chloroflexi bacterium]|nr:PIN domain-containing protein [Chloroflexota bacterium]